jgi:hypothetical protein
LMRSKLLWGGERSQDITMKNSSAWAGSSPIFYRREAVKMKLAIAQMALGTIILAIVLICPAFLFVVAVPGLAVLGCGIAQYLKSKKSLSEKGLVGSY